MFPQQWSWEKGQTVKMNETLGATVLVKHGAETLMKGSTSEDSYGTVRVLSTEDNDGTLFWS